MKRIRILARHILFTQMTMDSRHKLTRDTSMHSHLQKLPRIAVPKRPTADDCDRLRTVTNINATDRDQDFIPRFPELNENPSLRIREKK